MLGAFVAATRGDEQHCIFSAFVGEFLRLGTAEVDRDEKSIEPLSCSFDRG